MNIHMIGIDHHLAQLAQREKFSFTSARLQEALSFFRALDGVTGCVILSTCNRLEIYVSSDGNIVPDLVEALCRFRGYSAADYRPYFLERHRLEAVKHLFALAAGLESKIIGEDQILMQVKQALERARAADCTDIVMEVLFRMAITAGKRVKTETPLSHGNTSAVSAAVESLAASGVCFSGMRCMVIGNGEMGRLAASQLRAQGAEVTVTVRQYRSGEVQIPWGCDCIPYSERYDLLPQCDMVVSATSSPNLTLTLPEVEKLKIGHPVLFLDLAVPRDVDPAIAHLPFAKLYDIDSFSAGTSSDAFQNQKRLAWELLEEEIEKYVSWYECRDFVPAIRHISQSAAKDLVWRTGRGFDSVCVDRMTREALEATISDAGCKVVQKLLFALRDELSPEQVRCCLTALQKTYPEERI